MGVFTPAVAFTFIALSIESNPQFSWTNNALSDLGIIPDVTSTLFNFSLYVSGLMALWFAIGLYSYLNKNVIGKIGAIIFAGASLALEGIGWAPENIHPLHYIFSVAFFSLMPIALLVIAVYFLSTRENNPAIFTFLIAILAATPWALYFVIHYVPGVAIPELLSALAVSAWAIVIGWRMFRTGSRTNNPVPQTNSS